MVSQFSAGYVLCEEIEVQKWPKDKAVMPQDLYDALATAVGEPVVGMIGGLHYQFKPEPNVPMMTAVVPGRNHGDTPDAFLLQH